jgi:hypothetical protein
MTGRIVKTAVAPNSKKCFPHLPLFPVRHHPGFPVPVIPLAAGLPPQTPVVRDPEAVAVKTHFKVDLKASELNGLAVSKHRPIECFRWIEVYCCF